MLLAGVTVWATILAIFQRRGDRRDRADEAARTNLLATIVGLQQMASILWLFQQRVSILTTEPAIDAASLISGLDNALGASLSPPVTAALSELDSSLVYEGIFAAYEVIVKAIWQQTKAGANNAVYDTIRAGASEAVAKVASARNIVDVLLRPLQESSFQMGSEHRTSVS